MKRNSFNLCVLSGLLLAMTLAAVAQEEPNLARGLTPYGSYNEGNIDNVNLSNGNVNIRMDLWRVPQRGKLNLDYFWMYNNKSFFVEEACDINAGCTDFWSTRGLEVSISNSLNVGASSRNEIYGIGGN